MVNLRLNQEISCKVNEAFSMTIVLSHILDGQAKIIDGEESSSDPSGEVDAKFTFEVDITPNGGPYLGGTFRFKVGPYTENIENTLSKVSQGPK